MRAGGAGPAAGGGCEAAPPPPVLCPVLPAAPEPCAALFSCPDGFACVVGSDGNATCTSLCHRDYCRNHGVCAHPRGRGPLCRCPAGSDVWFVGLRCERRVTLSGLLGAAAGALLGVVLLGVAVGAAVVRRFRALLREARAEQGRSSYRRFCRPDEAAVPHWARSWPGSGSSLDNPAFSRSEELLHLHLPDDGCCCRRDPLGAARCPEPPARGHGYVRGCGTGSCGAELSTTRDLKSGGAETLCGTEQGGVVSSLVKSGTLRAHAGS